jgi:putative transposase
MRGVREFCSEFEMNDRKLPRKEVRHFDIDGDAHVLTFSCYHQLPLLSKDRARRWFVEALEEARAKHSSDVWACVIKPEHVHVLVSPRLPAYQTGKILASLKKPFSTRAIAYLKKCAPKFLERLTVRNANRTYHRFWQAGPGDDHNLDESRSIHRAIEYIHTNPVRRGLVRYATDWPWSSAGDWAGLNDAPIRVDRTVPRLHPGGQ